MKRNRLQQFLFLSVAIIGLASFVYLNTLDGTSTSTCAQQANVESVEKEGCQKPYRRFILPDVEFVKRVISVADKLVI